MYNRYDFHKENYLKFKSNKKMTVVDEETKRDSNLFEIESFIKAKHGAIDRLGLGEK